MTEEFKLRPDIKSGNPDFDEYVRRLHEYIQDSETSNITRLVRTLDSVASVLAEDLDKVLSGTDSETILSEDDPSGWEDVSNLKLLSDSKDSKVFERVMSLIDKVSNFEKVAQIHASMKPKIDTESDRIYDRPKVEKIVVRKGSNKFEAMQEASLRKREERGGII